MSRLQADLLLLLAAFIWGVAFYFQKTAMTHVGPLTFLALRGIVAALALAPLALREKAHDGAAKGSVVPVAAWGGAAFFVAAALQQTGLVTATITNASFLTSLYVVATPFIVWAVYRRAPSLAVWLAVALAFAGAWALGGGTLSGFSPGDWLIAGSAALWAGHLVLTGASNKFGRPILFTCVQFAVVFGLAGTAALAAEPLSLSAMRAAAPHVLFVGVLSGAVTFTILAVALRHTNAATAAVLVSMETIFAAMTGCLFLGERLPPIGWFGAALMFTAVLVVQLTSRRAVSV